MKFAVIEGLDGSGKSTQLTMLLEYLKNKGVDFEYLHFPRTDAPIFGDLVAKFLRGELGALNEVNPYLVALIYAGDRKDAALMINDWLAKGKTVIVDRYVFSNIAYQCAKISDTAGKEELKKWILNLEYQYYKIPKPSINIYLDVPFEFTVKNLTHQREGDDRDYLKGKSDIHEADISFQQNVREMYLNVAREDKSLQLIDCSSEGKMLPADQIFKKIIDTLAKENIL